MQTREDDQPLEWESLTMEEIRSSFASDTAAKDSFSSVSSEKSPKVADDFEPINVQGQKETGVWIHRPGREVSQTWEPRKGRSRRLDNEIQGEPNDASGRYNSIASGSRNNDTSSTDDNAEDKHSTNPIRRGLRKIGSAFHRHNKEDRLSNLSEDVSSPHSNIRATNEKEIGVKFVVEEDNYVPSSGEIPKEVALSSGGSSPDNPGKTNMKDKAKMIFKHAEKSARNLKHVISRKGSRNSRDGSSAVPEREIMPESDSSDEESFPSGKEVPVVYEVVKPHPSIEILNSKDGLVQTDVTKSNTSNDNGLLEMEKGSPERLQEKLSSTETGDVETLKSEAIGG